MRSFSYLCTTSCKSNMWRSNTSVMLLIEKQWTAGKQTNKQTNKPSDLKSLQEIRRPPRFSSLFHLTCWQSPVCLIIMLCSHTAVAYEMCVSRDRFKAGVLLHDLLIHFSVCDSSSALPWLFTQRRLRVHHCWCVCVCARIS